MRDLFDAIEQLSLLLSLRVQNSAKRKGWATKGAPFPVCPEPGRALTLTVTTVHLPLGAAALMTPREAPEPGGQAWAIDLRRTGSVLPAAWSEGLRVERQGPHFVLTFQGTLLTDEVIDALLDEMGRPEPSAMGYWLAKLWGLRFGVPPDDVRERLMREDNIDILDELHAGLLAAPSVAEARALVLRLTA